MRVRGLRLRCRLGGALGQHDGAPLGPRSEHGRLVRPGWSRAGCLVLGVAILLEHLSLHAHAPVTEVIIDLREECVSDCTLKRDVQHT